MATEVFAPVHQISGGVIDAAPGSGSVLSSQAAQGKFASARNPTPAPVDITQANNGYIVRIGWNNNASPDKVFVAESLQSLIDILSNHLTHRGADDSLRGMVKSALKEGAK